MGGEQDGRRKDFLVTRAGMSSSYAETKTGHVRSPGGARAVYLASILQVPAGLCLCCLLWWNDLIPHMTEKL